MRDKAMTLRLSAEEDRRFRRVAKFHNLDVSGMLRMLVRQEEETVLKNARERARKKGGNVKVRTVEYGRTRRGLR